MNSIFIIHLSKGGAKSTFGKGGAKKHRRCDRKAERPKSRATVKPSDRKAENTNSKK